VAADDETRIERALAAARALGWTGDGEPDLAALIDGLTDQLGERLRAVDDHLAVGLDALVALQEVRAERTATEERRRADTLTRIHDALARLRQIESPERLLERSTQEACTACGFDRAVLYRLSGSKLVAESFYVEGDPEWAAELLAASRADPLPLDQNLNETEALRRRRPVMIHDAQNHPGVYQSLGKVYKVFSYVGAPIVPEGRVIGFLHADHYLKNRNVDEFDRDALFAFAEGFGFAFERAVLVTRLQAQAAEVTRLLSSAEAVVRGYVDAEVELVRATDAQLASTRTTAALLGGHARAAGHDTTLEGLLTRREREVLHLLAAGATNSAIAEQLVVSEGTVKSHVKRILRRLGVRNRVEAAALYLRHTDERS
jgi:DNA-binding CsgD family transcriptional regulator